jgi:putative peptide zinc metalloprotease protein
VQSKRLWISLTGLAAVAGITCLVPFRFLVDAPLVVRPAEAQKVYVALPGVLAQAAVVAGQRVTSGQHLATLRNPEEQLKLQKLQADVAELEGEIARLNQLGRVAPLASTAIVTRQAELQGTRQQLELQRQRLGMLDLRAGRNGIVIPPPNTELVRSQTGETLAVWSGNPLDARNQGALLEAGTWYCSIAAEDSWEAVLMVPQSEIKLVTVGDAARIMLDEYPGRWLEGQVREVSREKVSELPRELAPSAGGPLAAAEPAVNGPAPLFGYYQVTLKIGGQPPQLAQGFRGRARIHVGKYTLAWRIRRFFRTVFDFG